MFRVDLGGIFMGLTKLFSKKLIKEISEWLKEDNNFYIYTFFTDKDYDIDILDKIRASYPDLGMEVNRLFTKDATKITKFMMEGKLKQSSTMFVLKSMYDWVDSGEEDKKIDVKLKY